MVLSRGELTTLSQGRCLSIQERWTFMWR